MQLSSLADRSFSSGKHIEGIDATAKMLLDRALGRARRPRPRPRPTAATPSGGPPSHVRSLTRGQEEVRITSNEDEDDARAQTLPGKCIQ